MIQYAITISPYLQKGTLIFDHENRTLMAHDEDDVREALYVLNTCNDRDQNFLRSVNIKWP